MAALIPDLRSRCAMFSAVQNFADRVAVVIGGAAGMGLATAAESGGDASLSGRQTDDAVLANRLHMLPYRNSRTSIRRRFVTIERTFDGQAARGWQS